MVGKAGRVGRIQADIFLIDGLQGTVIVFLPCFIGIVVWGGVYFCTEWVEEKNGENLYGAWV